MPEEEGLVPLYSSLLRSYLEYANHTLKRTHHLERFQKTVRLLDQNGRARKRNNGFSCGVAKHGNRRDHCCSLCVAAQTNVFRRDTCNRPDRHRLSGSDPRPGHGDGSPTAATSPKQLHTCQHPPSLSVSNPEATTESLAEAATARLPYCSALVILLNLAKFVGDFDSTQALMHFRFG